MPAHFSDGKIVPGSNSVVARAWAEPPAPGAVESFCVFLVAVNTGLRWTAAHGAGPMLGQMTNYTMAHMGRYGMPYSHGNWQFTASTPLRPVPARAVPVLGSGDTRYIVDFIQAGETIVYQLGCHVSLMQVCLMHCLCCVSTGFRYCTNRICYSDGAERWALVAA